MYINTILIPYLVENTDYDDLMSAKLSLPEKGTIVQGRFKIHWRDHSTNIRRDFWSVRYEPGLNFLCRGYASERHCSCFPHRFG